MTAMELSVVVPFFNEADNLLPLLQEIFAALDGCLLFEVVCVDDASSDATPAMLAEARRRFDRVRVLRHRQRCGQSTALVTGIRAAQAPLIATLDGDGQNDPADIPRLLAARAAATSPPDLVIGYRRRRRDTGIKRLSSRIANGVRRRLLGDDTPDTGCGLKVFGRELFLMLPYFDHMHRFLPALVQRQGGTVLSIEVNHRPRRHGQSKYGIGNRLWVGIVDLLGVMWLQRRMRRSEFYEEP